LTSVVLATFGCYVFIRWITIPILIVVGVVDKTPKYGRGGDDFRKRSSVHVMRGYAAGLRVYYQIYGEFPGYDKSMRETFNASGVGGDVEGGSFQGHDDDAWGTKFGYAASNGVAHVISAGPDRLFATCDDFSVDVIVCNGSNTVWDLPEVRLLNRSSKKKRAGLK